MNATSFSSVAERQGKGGGTFEELHIARHASPSSPAQQAPHQHSLVSRQICSVLPQLDARPTLLAGPLHTAKPSAIPPIPSMTQIPRHWEHVSAKFPANSSAHFQQKITGAQAARRGTLSGPQTCPRPLFKSRFCPVLVQQQ